MGNQSNIESKKSSIRFSDFLYFYWELVVHHFLQFLDDVHTPFNEKMGMLKHWFLNSLSGLILSNDLEQEKRPFLFAISRLGKIIIFIPLILFLGTAAFACIFIGASLASILGLRNLVQYSKLDQFVAWTPIVVGLFLLPVVSSDFMIFLFSNILVYSIILVGLDILYGHCGILTLGHATFAHIGAYMTVWFSNGTFGFSLPYFFSLPLAAVISASLGTLLVIPAIKVREHYMLIITFAFAHLVAKLMKSQYMAELSGLTFGGQSLNDTVPPPQAIENVGSTVWHFYLIATVFLLLMYLVYNLVHKSQTGRAFQMIKCDTEICEVMGASALKTRIYAFAFSALFAALGGGLFLLVTPFISPESYQMRESIDLVVALVFGGPGSIFGTVIGGTFLAFAQIIAKKLSEMFPKGQHLLSAFDGLVMILIVYLAPRGMAGLIRNIFKDSARSRTKRWKYSSNPPADYNVLERHEFNLGDLRRKDNSLNPTLEK